MSGAEALKAYLPPLYEGVLEFDQIMDSEGTELNLLGVRTIDVLQQFYPESATWALARYERDLQLIIDNNKPDEQRRSVIISKMRGAGKVSGAMIKNVAQAYDGGTVDVKVNPALYRIIITFIDTLGIPVNLDDLKQALEDIKPGHMAIEYVFRFLFIKNIDGVMTLNQLQTIPLSKFAGGDPSGQ